MHIKPGERSILAYFTDEVSAKQAASNLESVGFTDITIDHFGHQSLSSDTKLNSLSATVYGNSGYTQAFGALFAADPMVSGMSANMENPSNYNYILVMIAGADNYQEAVSIIRENGGYI